MRRSITTGCGDFSGFKSTPKRRPRSRPIPRHPPRPRRYRLTIQAGYQVLLVAGSLHGRTTLHAIAPQPRLDQLDRMTPEESAAVNKQLAAKEKALHSYGSTADKGFVQIPIEQAMKAVAGTLPVAKESPQGRAAKGNGLLEAGESNSGRMFRGPMP